jgi:trehalose-6-phosphate synthase
MKGAVLTTPCSHRRMDEAIEAALAMQTALQIKQLRAIQPEHKAPAR